MTSGFSQPSSLALTVKLGFLAKTENKIEEAKIGEMMHRIEETLLEAVPAYLSRSGIDCKVLKCEIHDLDQNALAYHAASKIYRAKLTLEDHGRIVIHNTLVKTMPRTAKMREIINSKVQFDNEHAMYYDVIPPLLKKAADHTRKQQRNEYWEPQALFPMCYYSNSGDYEHAMIALEDLTPKGYRIRGDPVTLAMEYCDVLTAVRALARFHALSYIFKIKEPENFLQNIAAKLKNTRPLVTDPDKEEWTHFLDYRHISSLLVCSRLEKEDKERKYSSGIQKMRELMNDPTLLNRLLKPVEPLAVICHGDYVMNNMLFKDNEMKMIDFQHAMYSSPFMDLATIFFMHSGEFINRWDELLREYHTCLIRCLGHQPKELSLDAFHEEFVRCGLFGYMISAAFLIYVSENPGRTTFEDDVADTPKDPRERRKYLQNKIKLENEDTARRVVELLRETIDRGMV